MSRTRHYMFVLWADRFDESAATVFVTEFRIAGLRTKLVSLVSHASAGAYGLALAPDLTLDQALALFEAIVALQAKKINHNVTGS